MDTQEALKPKSFKASLILTLVLGLGSFIVQSISFVFDLFNKSNVPSSSTAGLSLLAIPGIILLSLILGIFGFLLGKISFFKKPKILYITVALILVFDFLAVYSALYNPARDKEKQLEASATSFGVKTDLGIIKKTQIVSLQNQKEVFDCNSSYFELPSEGKFERELMWNEKKMVLSVGNNLPGYEIKNLYTGKIINKPLNHLNLYINSFSIFPYQTSGSSYLFVVANLRATSKRSLLTVYKYPNQKVYEELVERQENYLVLGLGKDINGQEIVTLSQYIGDYNNRTIFELCKLGKIDKKDFQMFSFGYKI